MPPRIITSLPTTEILWGAESHRNVQRLMVARLRSSSPRPSVVKSRKVRIHVIAVNKIGILADELQESQIDVLTGVLAAAFEGYPLAHWLLCSEHGTEQALVKLFQVLFALPVSRKFQIENAGNEAAFAVWVSSEEFPLFTVSEGRFALRCFRKKFGVKVARRILQFHLASESYHSKVAHDYLFLIGVRPDAQKRGLGQNLLQNHITVSAKLNRHLILETSNPSNIEFYRQSGFCVVEHYALPDDGPDSWILERGCPTMKVENEPTN
jgi:ribosomal protein S18 acetylase RimI-like enzyme